MRTPHPLLREKKESVNQFAKFRKLRSESTVIKKFSIIAEVPTITAFVAAFDAKALKCTELLESYLVGGTGLLTATGKPTEIATIEILDTTHFFVIFLLFPCLLGEKFCGCQLVKLLLLAIQYHQDLL